MSSFLPLVAWGPVTFTSGYSPSKIDGPVRTENVIEHQIPAREGGIVEYLGSKQPTYSIKGFLAPTPDNMASGVALAVLSGYGYYGLNPDDAMHYLQGLRGSGAQLLRLESTWSNYSGYPVLYENDFFYATSMTFAMEAGRGYPYYPYTIDLMRASASTYGNSSGNSSLTNDSTGDASGAYISGYIRGYTYFAATGFPKTAPLIGMGFYALAVHGTYNASLAIAGITSGGPILAYTASQTVTSGLNYFPLGPTTTLQSGLSYNLLIQSDAPNNGAFALGYTDAGPTGLSSLQSGQVYSKSLSPWAVGFLPGTLAGMSGYAIDVFVVTA